MGQDGLRVSFSANAWAPNQVTKLVRCVVVVAVVVVVVVAAAAVVVVVVVVVVVAVVVDDDDDDDDDKEVQVSGEEASKSSLFV